MKYYVLTDEVCKGTIIRINNENSQRYVYGKNTWIDYSTLEYFWGDNDLIYETQEIKEDDIPELVKIKEKELRKYENTLDEMLTKEKMNFAKSGDLQLDLVNGIAMLRKNLSDFLLLGYFPEGLIMAARRGYF